MFAPTLSTPSCRTCKLLSDAPPSYLTPPAPPPHARHPPPTHTQGHTTCTSDELIVPTSTAELAAAIKDVAARAKKAGRPLKMRTAHDAFATMQSFPCAQQPSDPNARVKTATSPLVVGILMDKMTKVLAHDKATHQLRVQAQIDIKGLLTYGNEHGLSPPRSSLPWWQGLTLGGIFSTASHGTGLNVTSMIVSIEGGGAKEGRGGGAMRGPRSATSAACNAGRRLAGGPR
jgi:hypothetical protein